jgi:peptidyl-prolyl cis-trans isomerase C
MNKLRTLPLLLLAMLGLLLTACGSKSPDDSKVLATINGDVITQSDYDDYLKARQMQQPPIEDKEKEKQTVMDEMVNRVLLVQNARKHGLDKELDVYFQIKRQTENILARAMLRDYLKSNPITDEEVQKRYEQEVEKTHKTEYRARHILVKTKEEADDLLKKLHVANFAALARDKSIDVRSGKEGGDLGWFNQGAMVPEFFSAVVEMKKGEVSKEPVKTEFGWHIIKLEDSRPLKVPPFEQVKANVRQLVQQEKIDTMVKELKTKAKINTSN